MAAIARVQDESRDVRGVGHGSEEILVALRGPLRIGAAAPVAQRIERGRPKACVGSSNLSGGALPRIWTTLDASQPLSRVVRVVRHGVLVLPRHRSRQSLCI